MATSGSSAVPEFPIHSPSIPTQYRLNTGRHDFEFNLPYCFAKFPLVSSKSLLILSLLWSLYIHVAVYVTTSPKLTKHCELTSLHDSVPASSGICNCEEGLEEAQSGTLL